MSGDSVEPAVLELENQLKRLATVADPASRAIAEDLLASVLQFHTAALERILAIVSEKSGEAHAILREFDRDPLVRSALLVHDLHPDSLQARISRVLAELQPSLVKRGCSAELQGVGEGVVKVRLIPQGETAAPAGPQAGAMIEAAIRSVAPEVLDVIVEEPAALSRAGFVPIENLIPAPTPAIAIQK